MKWGKEETFLKVKSIVENADVNGYNDIIDIIRADVIARVKAQVPIDYVDDVLQETYIKVFTYLVSYIKNFRDSSESQRNSWLSKIVSCRVADYWKQYYKIYHFSDKKESDSMRVVYSLSELSRSNKDSDDGDEDNTEFEISFKDRDLENITAQVPNKKFIRQLETVCSSRCKPESILAFLFQKYLFPKNKNAKPKRTAEILSEYTLGELFHIFLNSISFNNEMKKSYGNALFNLKEKLSKKEDGVFIYERKFSLSAKKITDAYCNLNKIIENKVSK